MKEAAIEDASTELRPGKGVRVGAAAGLINLLVTWSSELDTFWDGSETPQEMFDMAKEAWGTYGKNEYGERTWRAIGTRDQSELRLQLVLQRGRLAIDFREWYLPSH